jgi:hypothetical protein
LPVNRPEESTEENTNHRIEVIFMKTTNKTLAPFTMYTISLTNDMSVLILVEVNIKVK